MQSLDGWMPVLSGGNHRSFGKVMFAVERRAIAPRRFRLIECGIGCIAEG